MSNALAEQIESEEVSGVHELAEVPSTLDAQDITDLRWFFKTGGLDVFSGSTFGTQLEAAAMYAHRIRRCPKCKGSGFAPKNAKSKRPTTAYERAWMIFKRRKERLELVVADEQCRKCLGMGYLVMSRRQSKRGDDSKITARPTGGSMKGKKSPPSVTVADGDLARLGRVTARLLGAAQISADAVDVLAAYHGPSFDPVVREGEPSGHGRGGLFCVWPMTPAGKKLLRRSGSQAQDLYPLAALSNELAAQRARPEPNRGVLLRACETQAAELYAGACRAWNLAAAGGQREASK